MHKSPHVFRGGIRGVWGITKVEEVDRVKALYIHPSESKSFIYYNFFCHKQDTGIKRMRASSERKVLALKQVLI